jgi:tetratricopeptide (TPR) repeat protein
MAKKLNKNFVVGLSIVGFVAIIALSSLMIMSLRQDDPTYFADLAADYRKSGELKQAAQFYRRAWDIGRGSKSPKASEYLAIEGDIMLELGEVRRALASWNRAITTNPDLIPAHESQLGLLTELAKLGPSASAWSGVKDAAEALLAVEEANAFAHHALGLALLNLQTLEPENLAKGVAALERATQLAPEKAQYAVDLGAYYVSEAMRAITDRNDRTAAGTWMVKADAFMRELMERFATPGKDASLVRRVYAGWISDPRYGELVGRPHDDAETERVFHEAVELGGSDVEARVDARLEYAMYLMRRWAQNVGASAANMANVESLTADKDFIEAEAMLKECVAAQPDRFEPYMQITTAYRAANRFEDAIKYCEERLKGKITRIGLEAEKQRYGAFMLNRTASQCALAIAEKTEDAAQRETWVKKAEQYIADAMGEYPNHPDGLKQVGLIAWSRGEDRQALESFRKADEGYTGAGRIDWETKMILARVHLRLGEPGMALKTLDEVQKEAFRSRAKDASYWLLYAQVLLDNNKPELAAQAADHVLVNVEPGNQQAMNYKIAAGVAQGGAQPDLAELSKTPEGQFTAAILRAEQARRDGDDAGVIAAMKDALKLRPDHPEILRRAVFMLLSLKKGDEAQALVEDAIKYNPANNELKKLLVTTRRDLSHEEREAGLVELINAEPDAFRRLNELAGFYFEKGELAKALTALNDAEKCLTDPNKATPFSREVGKAGHRELLGRKMMIAARLDNSDALKAAADAAAQYNVDGANGYSFRGQYHMYREESDQAIIAFTEALRFQPTDARLLTYLARCYQNERRLDEARGFFDRAIESNPHEGLAHKGIAQVAQQLGNDVEYEAHFARCLELIPNDEWVLAEKRVREEEADPAGAIAKREAQLADKPDDQDNIRRLAVLSEKLGDYTKAEQYIIRLRELLPEDESLVAVLSALYHRANRPEKSLEVLRAHVDSKTTPDDKARAMIWVAAHYMKIGDPAMMERTLLEAADVAKTFEVCRALGDFYMRANAPSRALSWFDEAISRGRLNKNPQLPAVYTSRIICLLSPGLADIASAKQRVEEFRRTYPQDVRGLYFEAEIAANDGDIEKAVEALTKYLEVRPSNPSALFQRSKYNLALGRTPLAITDLERLRNAEPTALEMVPRVVLAKLYTSTGREDLARRELESALDARPAAENVLSALIDHYIQTNLLTEADQRLTAEINRAAEDPRPVWYELRAKISQRTNDHRKRIEDLKQVVQILKFQPDKVQRLLGAYLDAGNCIDGLKYCDEHGERLKEASSSVAMHAALLKCAGQEEAAVRRFRQAMDLAVKEGQGSSAFVYAMVLGTWPACQGADIFGRYAPDATMIPANDRILAGVFLTCGGDRAKEAPALLDKLLVTAANDMERAELLSQRGQFLQQAGKPEEAVAVYEEALKYNPNDVVTLNNLAYLLSDDLKQHPTALPYARKAVALKPDVANVVDTLGWIYVQIGNYDQGIAVLTTAVGLDDAPADCWYHLGEACRRGGKFEDAANILGEARGRARASGSDYLIDMIKASMAKVEARDPMP